MRRTGLIVSAGVLLAMAGVSLWGMQAMPDGQIPVHWSASGVADRFVDRSEAVWYLWFFPAFTVFVVGAFTVIPVVEPLKDNLRRSSKLFVVTWVATMLLFLCIHVGTTLMMVRGGSEEVTSDLFVRLLLTATGLLYIIMGNYMPKTRQNFMMGIRNPWTLSSEFAWEKTHKLGGKLFILSGLIAIVAAFALDGIWTVFGVVGPVLVSGLAATVYSYFVWRRAPDKRSSADYVV